MVDLSHRKPFPRAPSVAFCLVIRPLEIVYINWALEIRFDGLRPLFEYSPFCFIAIFPLLPEHISLSRLINVIFRDMCVSRRALIFLSTFIPLSRNYIQSYKVFERRRKNSCVSLRAIIRLPLSLLSRITSCPVERDAIKAKFPFFLLFPLFLEHLLRNVKLRDLFYSRITWLYRGGLRVNNNARCGGKGNRLAKGSSRVLAIKSRKGLHRVQ